MRKKQMKEMEKQKRKISEALLDLEKKINDRKNELDSILKFLNGVVYQLGYSDCYYINIINGIDNIKKRI